MQVVLFLLFRLIEDKKPESATSLIKESLSSLELTQSLAIAVASWSAYSKFSILLKYSHERLDLCSISAQNYVANKISLALFF